METFKDEDDGGKMIMVLGGKVLVVDLIFSINREDAANPKVDVTSVKTSYAISSGLTAPAPEASNSLDNFLADGIRGFCIEAQKNEAIREPRKVARLGKLIVEHLSYLMMLDKLATRIEGGGIRWFVDVDQFQVRLSIERLAASEAEVVASCVCHSFQENTYSFSIGRYLLLGHRWIFSCCARMHSLFPTWFYHRCPT
jgi:hypothetical protein